MSNNQVVIDTLTTKLEGLKLEQSRNWQQFQEQINEIEDALDKLAGKNVWRTENQELYNDTHPDYIKGTEDGI